MSEYIADGHEAQSMGADEMRLLGWYAVAICIYVSVRKLYAHKFVHGLVYLGAAIAFWCFPDVAAFVLFIAVTGLILLIGLSRK